MKLQCHLRIINKCIEKVVLILRNVIKTDVRCKTEIKKWTVVAKTKFQDIFYGQQKPDYEDKD